MVGIGQDWFKIIKNGFKQLQMVANGFKIDGNVCKQMGMATNGYKQWQMVWNGCSQLQIAVYGCKQQIKQCSISQLVSQLVPSNLLGIIAMLNKLNNQSVYSDQVSEWK